MSNVAEFTDESFETDVLKSAQPVLVDFWAPWCGPCRQIAPMIDELAAEYKGSISFGKVNVDENQDSAMKYDVQSIPTLIVFKNGQPVQRVQGGQPKRKLQEILDAVTG